jgi:DNA-binding MarR family transcriptional regulator/GNAT superfamily N-acetyltransferase
MSDARISAIRRFNRFVTQRIGALQDQYLGMRRPLGEARLLYEIGDQGAEIRELRLRLALDSGYTSRLLRSLERQGLATTPKTPGDRRVRRAHLTRKGKAELREVGRRSTRFAQSLLDPLNDKQRSELVAAMDRIESLLSRSVVSVSVESPTSRDALHCISEYYRELSRRFPKGFDPSKSLSPSAKEFRPPNGLFIVLRVDREPVGCGAFKRLSSETAYLKRMWISPECRGMGLGRRLLRELEDRARCAGFGVACLETNKALGEAQALYRAAGYRVVKPFNDEPYADVWFEKKLR